MANATSTIDRYAPHFETLSDFFMSFSHREAHILLHKMMRAAFAQKDMLTKRDIKDLVFLKDELFKLIPTAEVLAQHRAYRGSLAKFFREWPSTEWKETLNMLFYAAIYDGFFSCPPNHDDIYHYCRGLLALVAVCGKIYGRDKDKISR